VSIRSDPLDELAIPDGTTVEEHDLVTDSDVVVGGQSTVEFGVRGADVMGGERVTFGGHIEAAGDCRLDMWSTVAEDVLVGGDAYLGERVHVGGQLKVAGNVDIGDEVDIEERFEANGHIQIRNPMPTVVFLVIYLSQLLRIGEEEAAEQLASQLVEADEDGNEPVVIPRGARVGDDAWRVSTPARVGDDCRLHGNLRAESLTVGSNTTVFGSLRARGDVSVGEGSVIKGDVTTRNGDVRVASDATVWGDISAEDVELHEHAVVEGTIRVNGELTQIRDALGPEPPRDAEVTADPARDEMPGAKSNENDAVKAADGETREPPTEREPTDDAGSVDPDQLAESREAVEASLSGAVPVVDARGETTHPENGHDEDAEVRSGGEST
jgi:predicted acyltransferase (DUF342 family)